MNTSEDYTPEINNVLKAWKTGKPASTTINSFGDVITTAHGNLYITQSGYKMQLDKTVIKPNVASSTRVPITYQNLNLRS